MDELEQLTKQLKELRIKNRATEAKLAKRIKDITKTADREEKTKVNNAVVDRDGRNIKIGSKVSILTEGKFNSTQGTVTRMGKQRVTIKLPGGQSTTRNFGNVRTIKRE